MPGRATTLSHGSISCQQFQANKTRQTKKRRRREMEWSCGEIGSPGRQPPVHPEPLAAHAVELTTSPNQLVYKGLFINPTAFDHHVDQPSHQTLLRHGIHIASQLKPAASNHPIIHSFSTSIARKWTAAGSSSPAVVPCNSGAVVAAVFFLLSFSSCYSPSPIARRTLPPASSAATRHRYGPS